MRYILCLFPALMSVHFDTLDLFTSPLFIFLRMINVIISLVSQFQIVLDSDDKLFGGFNRIDHTAEYFTSVRNSI